MGTLLFFFNPSDSKSRMTWDNKARDYTEEANEINTLGPIVEELEISKFEHDPSSNSASTSIFEEELEERMICVMKDPYLKPILQDIETGGPTVMMRYLDDPEVFAEVGAGYGF